MIRISDIKISIEEDKSKIEEEILKRLKISKNELIDYKIYKESIDARKRDKVYFVYTVDVQLKEEDVILNRLNDNKIKKSPDMEYKYVEIGDRGLNHRPVVIGTGPSGLFSALLLAEMGYNPLVLERGKIVEERSKDVQNFWKSRELNPESNVQFGEGGAGTFSDGKLTTRIKDLRCRKVLAELIEAGAPAEIMYKNKAHVGTDILQGVVKNIREKIIALGGEVLFESKVTEILIEDNQVKGVIVNDNEKIQADIVILAIGHSARDTFEMIYQKGVEIKQKSFSIGVRIEHPQGLIDQTQYGQFAGHPKLGVADYSLSYQCSNGRAAYTFCMCPGGEVVAAASEAGMLVTNGMSEYNRDKANANSALLVGIDSADFGSEHPLAGVEFQRRWEQRAFEVGGRNYTAPAQLVGDFLASRPSDKWGEVKPSYAPEVTMTDLSLCLPEYVVETIKEALPKLGEKLKGFAMDDAVMTGVETRSSSPIRIIRSREYESNIGGLYPAGEGAGYAGGIMSAAVDGIRVAEAVISKYNREIKNK
jgi:hypothetical protein